MRARSTGNVNRPGGVSCGRRVRRPARADREQRGGGDATSSTSPDAPGHWFGPSFDLQSQRLRSRGPCHRRHPDFCAAGVDRGGAVRTPGRPWDEALGLSIAATFSPHVAWPWRCSAAARPGSRRPLRRRARAATTAAPSTSRRPSTPALPVIDAPAIDISVTPPTDGACVPVSCTPPGGQYCGQIGDGCHRAKECPACTGAGQTCTDHICVEGPTCVRGTCTAAGGVQLLRPDRHRVRRRDRLRRLPGGPVL